MVHYDVQLIGGIALHDGKIAEMATGEGKTLVATLPLYLNSLSGRNAQLVTANDYLARRDAEWMATSISSLASPSAASSSSCQRSPARDVQSDITYGTASEFGFDYLRDNGMATRKEDQVQRDHFLLHRGRGRLDPRRRGRTPLIISGPAPVEREQPFTRIKPSVEELVNAQTRLCNKLITEARELLDKADATSDDRDLALRKMVQVKMAIPRTSSSCG